MRHRAEPQRLGTVLAPEILEILQLSLLNGREKAMKRAELSEKILDIKRDKGWTWKHICEQIGGMSPVLITGALLGQMKLTKPQAAAAAKLFGLTKAEQAMLNEVPMRGTGTPMPPTDPLIYRFYELVMVNGPALKALIEEEFGDGIMSAIDDDRASERSQRRSRQDRHDRQVPALQVLRGQRQCVGIWAEGGVERRAWPVLDRSGSPTFSVYSSADERACPPSSKIGRAA
jgi:cyanate lyase